MQTRMNKTQILHFNENQIRLAYTQNAHWMYWQFTFFSFLCPQGKVFLNLLKKQGGSVCLRKKLWTSFPLLSLTDKYFTCHYVKLLKHVSMLLKNADLHIQTN